MSFCYTLKVHSFPFTMSLKLSPCALCQECYDRLPLQNYHKLLSSKKLGNAIKSWLHILLNNTAIP